MYRFPDVFHSVKLYVVVIAATPLTNNVCEDPLTTVLTTLNKPQHRGKSCKPSHVYHSSLEFDDAKPETMTNKAMFLWEPSDLTHVTCLCFLGIPLLTFINRQPMNYRLEQISNL